VSQVREPAFGTKMLHSVGLFVLQLSLWKQNGKAWFVIFDETERRRNNSVDRPPAERRNTAYINIPLIGATMKHMLQFPCFK
jgi:hypothetical protein